MRKYHTGNEKYEWLNMTITSKYLKLQQLKKELIKLDKTQNKLKNPRKHVERFASN